MIEKLPDGVHRLSDESIAIMKRIAERSAEQTARFTKTRVLTRYRHPRAWRHRYREPGNRE